ncbi:mitochondrial carrier [Fistulina hepatica ATCC 64428]|uniref:Mitochondrial carrier n=1 Tax=Fistulina hepatica ATCC 64428 TaxID=1128425 RepID=A0A0D7AC61_9AGAR|nr:mitochondrial carrier [Fistulina hepatica ATCC 64428]
MEASPDALLFSSPGLRAAKEIIFGSIAGMVSKVFEHPFDLTKVRLQSQVLDTTARFNGPVDCLRKTWLNEGIRGLYRGLPAPVVGAMAENASLFLSYSEFQNLIRRSTHHPVSEKLPLSHLALAAAGAGAVTSFLLTPIELVKCKMQVQMLVIPTSSTTKLPGPISVLMSVIRDTGVRGLWLGQTGTFIRETGGTAAWFGTKEFIGAQLLRLRTTRDGAADARAKLKTWESAFSGACAGAAFNIALFPADTVKSTIQTEAELRPVVGKAGPAPTFFRTFTALYKAQGIRGLYAGCGVTIARSIPSSALIFVIYDELDKRFG